MTYRSSSELEAKHKLYLDLLPSQQSRYGFIDADRCDSTLFSALVGCVPDTHVNIHAARRGDQWFRRPLYLPECYASGGATSEISRDMFAGLAWLAWADRDSSIAESVCDYALGHFGVMGRGKLSQTLMSPSLLNTFAWISCKLGGKSYPLLRLLPCYISAELTGYQRHLAVLHALLRRKMGLKVDHAIFLKAAYRQPDNPLFNYAAGFPEAAESQLLKEQLWPANRLPTNRDRSESWVLQRDWGDDWLPDRGPLTKTFSGGDFLFVSALLQGLI